MKIFKEKGPHHTKKDFFSLRKFRGIQHKNRSLRGVRESPRTKSNTHSSYGGARAESRRRAKFVELYAVTGCVCCCCCCCFCSLLLPLLLLLFPFLKGDENRILDLKTRGCSILNSQRELSMMRTPSHQSSAFVSSSSSLLLPRVSSRLKHAREVCVPISII